MRTAASSATISASTEEGEAQVCFLEAQPKGKKVWGPTKAENMPLVDL